MRSGFGPPAAAVLLSLTRETARVSVMLIILAIITLIAALFARETKDDPLFR
jgi:MHS family shikimate/dehydroshikimate transporter-like MFS transporter